MRTTTRPREITVSLPDFRIAILNLNAVDVPTGKEIFGIASTILALVRDTMIDNEYAIQLSGQCFDACETLRGALQGKYPGNLSESERMAIVNLDRVMREVESTLRMGVASTPLTNYDKDKVESYMQNIQQTLCTLHAPRPSLGEDHGVDERTTMTGYGCLLTRGFTPQGLPSLIDMILLNGNEGETIQCLPVAEVQTFVHAVDEALRGPDISSKAQNECLRLLYRMCGHHELLPGALKVQIRYGRPSNPLYRGGHADVWKGRYRGQDMAVKVIRTYATDDLREITHRFCKEVVMWRFLRHPNILPLRGVSMSGDRFAMLSEWMPNGNINEFVEAYPEVDRHRLLAGVAKGLIYLHSNEMVHGDLKGTNILVDDAGQARLADFGLLTIISGPANHRSSSSGAQGGTVRWMSPELIDPEHVRFDKGRPTKFSDCFALGMVIHETISGKLPFHEHRDCTVSLKVARGERPYREAEFKEDLWKMLESCWAPQPDDRPSAEAVLRYLETVSNMREPPAQAQGSSAEHAIRIFPWKICILLFVLTLIAIYY